MNSVEEHGFTALHLAAMGTNSVEEARSLEVMKCLLEAGADLEAEGDGRTPLYFAAEFSPTLGPVQLLLDAGAKADVSDRHGNHITVNAMTPEVQELLARVTGVEIFGSAHGDDSLESAPAVPVKAAEWRALKKRIDAVFGELTAQGLVCLQDAGTTQEEGFSECAEELQRRTGRESILGFCFYTRQDLKRAKRDRLLPLAIWGSPDGEDPATRLVGQRTTDAFTQADFEVEWDGTASSRPILRL